MGELLSNQYTVVESELLWETAAHQQILKENDRLEKNMPLLWEFGPFPEPLFAANPKLLNLWQSERIQRLIREDLRDLSRIQELS